MFLRWMICGFKDFRRLKKKRINSNPSFEKPWVLSERKVRTWVKITMYENIQTKTRSWLQFVTTTSRFEIYDLKLKGAWKWKLYQVGGKKKSCVENTKRKSTHFYRNVDVILREKVVSIIHGKKGSWIKLEFVIMVGNKKIFILTFCFSWWI